MRIILTFLGLLSCSICFAQTSVRLPVQFDQVHRSLSLFNPAYIKDNASLDLSIGNNVYAPQTSAFRTHYFVFRNRINPDTKNDIRNSQQFAGTNLIIDRESRFIRNFRFHLNYAYKTQFDSLTSVMVGAGIGVFNKTLFTGTFNSSEMTIDGNFGIIVRRNRLEVGASLNQMFNSRVSPVSEVSVLQRYPILYASKEWDLSKNLMFCPYLFYGRIPDLDDRIDISGRFSYKNKLGLAVNYRYMRQITIMLGLEGFKNRRSIGVYDFYLSSNIRIDSFPTGAIELTMSYRKLNFNKL